MLTKHTDISHIFPDNIHYLLTKIIDSQDSGLFPAEKKIIQNSRPKRRQEFIAGRANARQLLKKLDIEETQILSGKNREPLWPQNIVGSISHCNNFCLVAIAQSKYFSGLGVDIEPFIILTDDIKTMICTKNETLKIKDLCFLNSGIPWVNLFFSIKESVYKCVFPLIEKYIDFHDIEIDINQENNSFHANLTTNAEKLYDSSIFKNITGYFFVSNGYTFTVASIKSNNSIVNDKVFAAEKSISEFS